MQSHEAIAAAVQTKAIEFAKRLGLSTSMIYKWMEPSTDYSNSGALNPLDRIESIVETARQFNPNKDAALAPLQYLNERFGLIAINTPKTKSNPNEISQELLKTVTEFGELVKVASAALEDGVLTDKESQNINTTGWQLLRQVAAFLQKNKGYR